MNSPTKISTMKPKCKWCKKGIMRGNFCGYGLHRKLYENFRAGFRAEMYDVKLKPKVSDSKAYKKVISKLTNLT